MAIPAWDQFFLGNVQRGLEIIGESLTEQEDVMVFNEGISLNVMLRSDEPLKNACRLIAGASLAKQMGQPAWDAWCDKGAKALRAAFLKDVEEASANLRRRFNGTYLGLGHSSRSAVAVEWNQNYLQLMAYSGRIPLMLIASQWHDLYGRRDMKRALRTRTFFQLAAGGLLVGLVAWWLQ